MYLKEMFNGEIISYFKKKIEKIVLLQVKDLIQMIVKFMTEKIYLHISLSSTKHPFEGHDILCTKYCVAILWKGKLEVYGSSKENKLTYFTNSKVSFHTRFRSWFLKTYYLRQYGEYVSSPCWCTHVPKSLSKQGIQ